MSSKSQSRIILSLLALACTAFPLGLANEHNLTYATDEYERTLRVLNHYRALAAEDDGASLPATEEPVEPGEYYADVPRLIRLLTLIGDLPPAAVSADSAVYEGALVEAVKRFQSRHGLEPDGGIDKTTLEQLNTPLSVRVRQLELALERLRRRAYDPARPAIVLNLPEFRLRAFGGKSSAGPDPELDMKVVVGDPEHRTPILLSQLNIVIFCPYWTVPASIQHNELLPEIRRDPSWVSDNHFELVTKQGGVAEDQTVSEPMLSKLSTGQLLLRQKPGPKNTLGLVKFGFPNEYGVYMHDTSARWLFAQAQRDLSHGCIRVEQPEDLAEWVLRRQAGWPRDRVVAAMHGTEPISVKVKFPIQVVTTYSTAVVMDNGEVHFFPDIYGQDAALEKQLAARRHTMVVNSEPRHSPPQ